MSDIHCHPCPEYQRRSQGLQHLMAVLCVASKTQNKNWNSENISKIITLFFLSIYLKTPNDITFWVSGGVTVYEASKLYYLT